MCVFVLSHVWFFVAPWMVAHQAPLSMEFSRQEYWSAMLSSRGSEYEHLILLSLFSDHPVREMSVWVL